MDILPEQPVPQTPPAVPALKTNVWVVVSGVLALLLIGVGAAWALTSPKAQQENTVPEVATITAQKESTVLEGATTTAQKESTVLEGATTTPQTASVPTVWKLYENREIGIAFEYPEAWGTIRQVDEVGECDIHATVVEKESGDPCKHVRLVVGERGTFLATRSELQIKYPIGRGGYWGDVYVKDVVGVENYCSDKKENCSVYRNSNDVLVAKSHEFLFEFGEIQDWIYRIRSSHTYYQSVVLSPSRLPSEYQKDFEHLVDTLRFTQ